MFEYDFLILLVSLSGSNDAQTYLLAVNVAPFLCVLWTRPGRPEPATFAVVISLRNLARQQIKGGPAGGPFSHHKLRQLKLGREGIRETNDKHPESKRS